MFRNTILKLIRFFINKLGKHHVENLIVLIAKISTIDLLLLAYKDRGILKYWNNDVSGENFVIQNIIKTYFKNQNKIYLFDIGANIGDYSKTLREEFPQAEIYAFEPNPHTFEELCKNVYLSNINCYDMGVSSKVIQKKIYTYANDKKSQHASLYSEVISDLHQANQILEMDFTATTIDDFCSNNKIDIIDFIKIDTEGHELEVLQGSKRMINEERIKIIQFEFNEMNIISRVFLKDFYEILKDYNIYRIDSSRLIPLFKYNSSNEIFQFQNLLAIHKKMQVIV